MKSRYYYSIFAMERKFFIMIFFLAAISLQLSVRVTGQTISGTFTSLAPSTRYLTGLVADPPNGYIYAISEGDGDPPALFRYSIAANTWTTLAMPPIWPDDNAGAALLNGKIYFAYTGNPELAIYDISGNTWTTLTGPGDDGANTGNIATDGTNIYLLCEEIDGRAKFWRYSVAAGTWTNLAPAPLAEQWGGLSYQDGYFYFQQGDGNPGFFRYRVLTNTWETLDNVPENGAVLGSAITDAYFYCIGSYYSDPTYLYSYDIGLKNWNNSITLPWSIGDAGICVVNGSLYIIQGENGFAFTRFDHTNPLLMNMETSRLTYTIGSGNVNITSTLTVSQNGGTNLTSATVVIAENYQNGKDVLSFVNNYGITGSWSAATGTLTLSGSSSIANYQLALRSVQYSNADNTSAGRRVISFQVSDGTKTSNIATRTIAFPGLPEVYTTDITNIVTTTATSGGTVYDDGGASVTARGVCWNTTGSPTTDDSKTTDGTGTGSFTSSITGLTIGNYYYVRAYATTTNGTAYGEEKMLRAGELETLYAGADKYIIPTDSAQLSGIIYTTETCEGFSWSTSGDGYFLPDIMSSLRPVYVPGSTDISNGFTTITLTAIFSGPVTVTDDMTLYIEDEDPPVAGTLTKSPNTAGYCIGSNVSATLTAGSGGNGTDETQYRTYNGSTWSSWASYSSGSNISTTGKTSVEIRTRRLANAYPPSGYNTVSWTGETAPVSGTLTKSPNQAAVCIGTNVSASLTAGSGGSGVDSTYSRTKASSVWSAWTAYTSATDISTTGKTDVEIRTKRKGTYCSDASWNTVSWVVEQTPVSGTLAKSPDQATVCEGSNVAATLTAGSGGSNVDSTYSRTKAGGTWSAWTAYTSASNISTTGKTDVEIRTKRKGTQCSDASWSTVSWVVEQTPVTGTLAKSPDQAAVCEGADVAATLTAGSGGSNVDSTYSRTKAGGTWSAWTAYTSAANISTTGKTDVEIRTKRKGTECSDASWTTVSWVVEQTPVTGTLAKSPDQATVCEGSNVAATLTAGSGGSNVDSTYSRTKAGGTWSAWTAYTSASNISTTGKTDVEIRTKRKGTQCSDASWSTVSWVVEQTPVTGTLAKNPDVSVVCEGTLLSATFTAGSGGNGNDELEIRSHDGIAWSSWSDYTSDTDFSSSGKIQVQIRARRSADYCAPSDYDTVFWLVDSTTVGGVVTGGTEVCYGSNSTLLTLEDEVGKVQKWQYSTDGLIWQDLTHTSTQYTATDLIVDTWYRAVVKSGECLTETSDSALITLFADYHISGFAKYENNPHTPLDGLKITLKKEGTQLGEPVITGSNGYYEFTGLINGNYSLEISSAHPSGLWQTWGGVNNTDYLLVSKHIAGTQYLPTDPPVVRITASTKLPHPAINNTDALAIRQAAKFPLTGYTYFDIPKWVFSGTTALTPIDAFTLNCASVTRDIKGLCAGDVNGTYVPPSGNKNMTANLELLHRGRLPLTSEITIPIQAEMDMEIGAITLILDFDASNLLITGVEMPGSKNDIPWYRVEGNTLYIGWMSLDAIRVARGESLLLIHGSLTGSQANNSGFIPEAPVIRFNLNQNPLCELADANGEVLYDAKLAVMDAGPIDPDESEILVSIYPNPAKDVLNIEAVMLQDGLFHAELLNITGAVVRQLPGILLTSGINRLTMDIRDLPGGAYLMRMVTGNQTKMIKVIVRR